MRVILLTLSLVTSAACSHPRLSERGSEIVLLRPDTKPTCERIAMLVGKSWGSAFFGDVLLASAENGLRNRAAEVGATHVLPVRYDPSAHAYFLEGDAYHCGPAVGAAANPNAAAALPPPTDVAPMPGAVPPPNAAPPAAPSPDAATPAPPAAPTP